jgi:hypothetical protein
MIYIQRRNEATYQAWLKIHGVILKTVEGDCPDRALRNLGATNYITVVREYEKVTGENDEIKTMAIE